MFFPENKLIIGSCAPFWRKNLILNVDCAIAIGYRYDNSTLKGMK